MKPCVLQQIVGHAFEAFPASQDYQD